MPTTFAQTYFKHNVLNAITGTSIPNSSYTPRYVQLYSGVQPAKPEDTPVGTAVFSAYTNSIDVNGRFSVAGGGVSQLSSAAGAVAAASVSPITFARVLTATNGYGLIDTPVSLAGGGGGAILDTLTTNIGSAVYLLALSFKLTKSNGGTLKLGQMLVNRIIDNFTYTNTPHALNFGINTNGTSQISLYSGTPPDDADLPATGTLLVSWNIGSSQIFGSATGGAVALLATLTSAAAVASGTATYARWTKADSSVTLTLQGSVGTSGADFLVSSTDIVAGSTYTLNDATLSI